MNLNDSSEVSRLIRRLRAEAGLTQTELAVRIGTTQSVISRLEGDDYEGHSLSMLYRIGAALNRRIAVTAMGVDGTGLTLREIAPVYGSSASTASAPNEGLARGELERLVDRLTQRFGKQGVTRIDVEEAIRWARGAGHRRSVEELRGALAVGPGDVADDIRRARTQRGHEALQP